MRKNIISQKVGMEINQNVRTKELECNDPIHCKKGEIISLPKSIAELFKTPEFKRLWNIKQLGYSYLGYPSCKYLKRAEHSIGAVIAFTKFIWPHIKKEVEKFGIEPSDRLVEAEQIALFLHDIGHLAQSHGIEKVTKKPHEQLTKQMILEKDGNVRKKIEKYLGENGPELVIYLIKLEECSMEKLSDKYALTPDDEKVIGLFRQCTSHSIDADRLDYLARDYYYAFGRRQREYSIEELFENMTLRIDTNGEVRRIFTSTENYVVSKLLHFRLWMYQTVYDCPQSDLADYMMLQFFNAISALGINEYANFELETALKLDDERLETIYKKYRHMDYSNMAQYMDNEEKEKQVMYVKFFAALKYTYKLFKYVEGDQSEKIKNALLANLPKKYEEKIKKTKAIVSTKTNKFLYKEDESLEGFSSSGLMDLSECTHMLNHDIYVKIERTFFSKELFIFELGIKDKMERSRLTKEVEEIVETAMKPELEFELKFGIPNDKKGYQVGKEIIELLQSEGFKVNETKEKSNEDVYFDTPEYDFLNSGITLRYRVKENKREDVEWTFKLPQSKANLFASRFEFNIYAQKDDMNALCKMLEKRKAVNDKVLKMVSEVSKEPTVQINTRRQIQILVFDGVELEFSIDDSIAKNLRCSTEKQYSMIEIELKSGKISDTAILKKVSDIITQGFEDLQVMKENKYSLALKDKELK